MNCVDFYLNNRHRWDQFSEMILLPDENLLKYMLRKRYMEKNFEIIEPIYIDKERIPVQPVQVYRTMRGQKRYYYSIDKTGRVLTLPSVTTVLSSVMPTSEFLIKWISDMGKQKAEQRMKEAADYGTLMHICFSDYLLRRTFDIETIPARIDTFKRTNRISYDTRFWRYELEKDMMAFHVYCYVHDVKPVAISIMLMSEKLGIAGEIDVVVDKKIGTGQNGNILKTDITFNKDGSLKEDRTRRVLCIEDWKSGRHGFYPQHEAQLHLYKNLWEDNFPFMPIDRVFNWSPKEWNTEPAYTVKDQTDSREARKIDKYIELFNIDQEEKNEKSYVDVHGTLELGKMNGNIDVLTFEQRAQLWHGKPATSEEIKAEDLKITVMEPDDEF